MIRGILFDKDGTLIDFSLWRNAAINVIKIILEENDLVNDDVLFKKLKVSIGIKEKGVDPFGALADKSHSQVAKELYHILSKQNKNLEYEKFNNHVVELLSREVLGEDVEYQEITDLKKLFKRLGDYNIKIGIATSDSIKSTMNLINKLDLNEYIDFIGSNDGNFKIKPNSDICHSFCNKFKLLPDEVAIVGDSYSDMLFAKNSGAFAIGVLSGVSCKINLKDIADIIIPSIEFMFNENLDLFCSNLNIKGIKLCSA